MKSMKNNKTRGNDGLAKEFDETFWDELKTPLMESINQAFQKQPHEVFCKKRCS